MKVLYVIDPGTIGGATNSFLEMILQLKTKNIDPIVCVSEKNDFCSKLETLGIKYIECFHRTALYPMEIRSFRNVLGYCKYWVLYSASIFRAIHILNRSESIEDISLIHTNSARNDIGCYLSIMKKVPHCMHIREFSDLDFDCKCFNPFLISLYNRSVNVFITISNAVASHWINKGIHPWKVRTIYNGINYSDIEKSQLIDKFPQIKMVIVGGVMPTKGQEIAIMALSFLPEDIKKNVSLDIIGWGSSENINRCNKLIAENDLTNIVKVLGAKETVHQLLCQYNVGLMCSRSEGFGRTTAEYMHAGLGVIASDSGANPELIEENETGLLFETGNAKALANCIITYYNDRELLKKCAENAFAKAHNEYTHVINAENVFNLYQEIVTTK